MRILASPGSFLSGSSPPPAQCEPGATRQCAIQHQGRTPPRRSAALPPLPGSLGGEDVKTGFMASASSLARFASRCSGASPGAQPNRPPGILQLRASGIRGRPVLGRRASVRARAAPLGAPCAGWPPLAGRGGAHCRTLCLGGLRRAKPAPWRGLRHPPCGHATDRPCTGVMWSKFRQKCYAARVFRPNST